MRSKLVIWDFYKGLKNKSIKLASTFIFLTDEVVYADILKKYLKAKGTYRTVFAEELNLEWFENNVFGLSLFGNENYIINNAEKLKSEIIEKLNGSMAQAGGELVFIANKLVQIEEIPLIEIVPPNFWQADKLLDFLIHLNELKLDMQAKEFILDFSEHSVASFQSLLLTLKSLYSGQVIGINELDNILEKNRLDRFSFATLLSQKKVKEFFRKLGQVSTDEKNLRSFLQFMQSHMFKIFDPSYGHKKSKLTKYDMEILEASKRWKADSIEEIIDDLKLLEWDTKINIPNLSNRISAMILKYDSSGLHK